MVVRPLDRKLLRDLWHIKGQAFAISLVIATGVAMYVAYLSNFDSLWLTQTAYYERQRFADVFGRTTRTPLAVREQIAAIPGVSAVDTRVVMDVNLDVPGLREPATGRLISVPVPRRDTLNDLVLRSGRWVEPGRPDEVLVSEAFADAHRLTPGSSITAVVNGRRRRLDIVGTALSPEYIYSIRPGDIIPDDSRFGVFWMEQRALAAVFDMEGGFNDVALKLMPGTSAGDVIARLDTILARYGGLGAQPRALQLSHWYINNELTQLQSFGRIVPIIFFSVAACLLHVVLTRIVSVRREQIAALKALGYSNREIAGHYVKWSLVITTAGTLIGIGGGAWLGLQLVGLYNLYFRFPTLTYTLAAGTALTAAGIAFGAGVLGALSGVLRAARLPPAEAMRPEAPPVYRETLVERLAPRNWLAPPSRMIVRNLSRQPVRALLSIVGIAFSAAMMIVGTFTLDSLDVILDQMFGVAQRQDLTMTFVRPVSSRALHEVGRLPGVVYAEPSRTVPARLRIANRSRQVAIIGLAPDARLNRVIDVSGRVVTLPEDGLVLSTKLAEILDVGRGEAVTVEVLEGGRPVYRAVVADLVEEYMGLAAYMQLPALHRLMREGDSLSGAFVQMDAGYEEALYRRLKSTPVVAGIALKRATIENFQKTIAQNITLIIVFNVLFSTVIACGVVYNAALISLSERSRDLASLRVLGFTRAEISFILLGELALVTAVAVPAGMLLGYGLSALTVRAFDSELYRIPLAISSRTYAWSAIVVGGAAALSALAVRRRLDRLDLVAVLKAPE